MGTEVSVYLWSDDPEAGRRALEEVFQEAGRIDRLMSTYKDESEISKINREAAEHPVVAGDELFGLIQRSLDISVLTRGAFDITYDSVGQHYDFREHQRPDAGVVASERPGIDYRLVKLDRAAGVRLIEKVRDHRRDIPIVLQSSIEENRGLATDLDAMFLLKGSQVLLHDLRRILVESFGFGDFVVHPLAGFADLG